MPSHPPCVVTAAASVPVLMREYAFRTSTASRSRPGIGTSKTSICPFPDKKTCFMLAPARFDHKTQPGITLHSVRKGQDFCSLSHTIPRTYPSFGKARLRWCLPAHYPSVSTNGKPSVIVLHHDFDRWIKVQIAFYSVIAHALKMVNTGECTNFRIEADFARMEDGVG